MVERGSGALLLDCRGVAWGAPTGDELCEEAGLRAEDLLAVAHGPPQHPPQDVAAPLRRGQRPVGDGEGQRAGVVGDDAVRRVLRRKGEREIGRRGTGSASREGLLW